ncbi:hypothetical protein BHE74_00030796 [Ensete ventricosum]|nr:hypothetical protein GW17_00016419 [Ensete ventricosum]RWW62099.1 hypothetical protein BHE74_00030796 [Ensete ventricosum]RZR98563.1 hypothetical protein BHM03_00027944 [Ensete ventricosum]
MHGWVKSVGSGRRKGGRFKGPESGCVGGVVKPALDSTASQGEASPMATVDTQGGEAAMIGELLLEIPTTWR